MQAVRGSSVCEIVIGPMCYLENGFRRATHPSVYIKVAERRPGCAGGKDLAVRPANAKSWNIISLCCMSFPRPLLPQSPWPTIGPHGRVKLLETVVRSPRNWFYTRWRWIALGKYFTRHLRVVITACKTEGTVLSDAWLNKTFISELQHICNYNFVYILQIILDNYLYRIFCTISTKFK